MDAPFKVVVSLAWQCDLANAIVAGVQEYLRAHDPWEFIFIKQDADLIRSACSWEVDGYILGLSHERERDAVRDLTRPCVCVDKNTVNPRFCRVYPDDDAIGVLAADYFINNGYKHYAYVGPAGAAEPDERKEAFVHHLHKHGLSAFVYTPPPGDPSGPMEAWLAHLPKPIALFSRFDYRAVHVCNACRRADLKIPEEIAVLGVDNDTKYCEGCIPPISSIRIPFERNGYLAAQRLNQMMRGDSEAPSEVIGPEGIQVRQSTDILAIDDTRIARAVHYIRTHSGEPVNMADVAYHSGINRRAMERGFKKYLNRSPQAELIRVRINKASDLLRRTSLALDDIAERTGMTNANYMGKVFRSQLGHSPSVLRESGSPPRRPAAL